MLISSEIASEWWRDHAPSRGLRLASDYSDEEWDRAESIGDFLGASAKESAPQLTLVIEALARTAPSKSDLSYVGTWFMEEAFPILGDEVFAALSTSSLSEEEKAIVLSGFQW